MHEYDVCDVEESQFVESAGGNRISEPNPCELHK